MPDTQASPDIQKVLVDPNFLKLSGSDQVAVLKHMQESTPATPPKATETQKPGLLSKGFDIANKGAEKLLELSPVPLPKGFADIPHWAMQMLGQAPDSKPFWDDIHQAAKNPTQENLVKAVPLFGPPSVEASQDLQNKNYGSTLLDLIKPTAQVAAGGALSKATSSGLAARGVEAVDRARVAAASDLNKAIPATKMTPYTPEDVKVAQPYLAKEHAGSPITTVKEFRDAADGAVQKIEGQVHNAIQAVSANHATAIEFWPQTLADTKAVLAENARGAGFVKAGLKELEDFQLDQPKTLFQQDAIRRQLNAENSATLRKNNYTVDIARKSDPAFAAREAAAESLRNSIYDTLSKQGYDTGSLRHDEGSIIRLRNAAENQIYNAEKKVAGTGGNRLGAQLLAGGIGAGAGLATGELVGHPGLGAFVGTSVGERLGRLAKAENLTRNELVERSFSIPQGNPPSTAPVQPSGAATIGDILKAKGMALAAPAITNATQSPQLPFHPGAGIPKP